MRIVFILLLVAFSISCSESRSNKANLNLNAPSEIRSGFDAIIVKQGLENSYLFNFMRKNRIRSLLADINDTSTELVSSNISVVMASDSLQYRVRITEIRKCRAYMSHDTLFIYNYNGGEVGAGVEIKVIGNQFRALPYFSSHVVYPDTIPILILNQGLSLHKPNFSVGDSIFGDLHLRAKEGSINWFVDGLFRAKIEKGE